MKSEQITDEEKLLRSMETIYYNYRMQQIIN